MLTFEHPLTGEKLQIANKDFTGSMTWEEAMDACRQLGSGWRLPTKEELSGMYEQLYKEGLGNFEEDCYWSSTESANGGAWCQYYPTGGQDDCDGGTARVRAVRAF